MTKTVLDIGNCRPDHASIKRMLVESFGVEVVQAHEWGDAIELLRSHPVDLILVNRKLDIDYSDGLDVIKRIKQDPAFSAVPTMLVSDMDQYQQQAILEGAEYGFGKSELRLPKTHQRLAKILQN